MITTTRLGLTVWNLGSDPYNHLELAANWQEIDDELLKRTGDTAVGALTVERASGSDPGIHLKLAADSASRLKFHSDGVYFGDGSGSYDIKLYRDAANVLKSNDQFASDYAAGASFVSQASASVALEGHKGDSQSFVQNKLNALDANPSLSILGSGEIRLGEGGASATDVRIYRSGVGRITIEDDVVVDNLEALDSITIGGVLLNVSGGAIQSNSSLITANVIRARDGQTGRTQLGDASDPAKSIIYFGGSADVNLFRDGADRLRTDDSLTIGSFLQVNSTASDSIETEGGIDVAGVSQLTGAVTMGSTANVTSTLTVTGGAALNGRSSIGSTYTIGNLFRGKQLWIESATNSNLWYLTNGAQTLQFRSTAFNASGPGGSDTVRMSLDPNGNLDVTGSLSAGTMFATTATFSSVISVGGLNTSGSISGNTATLSHINSNTGTFTSSVSVSSLWASGIVSANQLQAGASGVSSSGPVVGSYLYAIGSMSQLNSLLVSNGPINVSQDVGYIRAGGYSAPPTLANSIIGYDIVAWGRFYSPFAAVTAISDIDKKKDLVRVPHDEILTKIKGLKTLTRWQYDDDYVNEINTMTGEGSPDFDGSERFYGPSAQEWNKLFKPEVVERVKKSKRRKKKEVVDFGSGIEHPKEAEFFSDDKMVNVYDIAGVSLMGVQALIERVEALEKSQEK